MYVWADGIYSGLRGEDGKLCVLVVVGVNERGQKALLAIEDGVRESTQSWREVLVALKERGLSAPPKLAVERRGAGLMGGAGRDLSRHAAATLLGAQTANVLNYAPKAVQPKMKQALQEIWMAETRAAAVSALDHFVKTFGDKYPKATECLHKDRAALLAFYELPAAHWQHVRSSNVIESAFATLRHRSDRAEGCVTRDTMLAFIYKLGMAAQTSWRRLRGFEHLAKVVAGVKFRDGVEVKHSGRRKAIP